MARVHRTHADDESCDLVQPFHQTFLGGESENLETPQGGGNTFIANDHSRQIGYVNQIGPTYQYYGSNKSSEYSPILEWLWPNLGHYSWQNNINKYTTEARKGQADPWLLKRDEFNNWFSGTGGSLWIWGKVGCGKTVLFSNIIKHIRSARASRREIRLGYYYCQSQHDTEGQLGMILRRWLAQISDKNDVNECLQQLHKSCHDSYPPRDPTSEELETALPIILRAYGSPKYPQQASDDAGVGNKIFLLIDALDELPIKDGQNVEVLDMLRRIAKEKFPNVFILATSRDRADIGEYLRHEFETVRMDYEAIDQEIRAYVPRMIKSSPRLNRQSADIKDAIMKRLVLGARGMFLWAVLQMRLLQSLPVMTHDTISKKLLELPDDLNGTYRKIFASIDENLAPKALLALKWIVLAKRSLFIEELVEACAFRAAPAPELESESMRLQPYNLFELLQDLVVIEPHLGLDGIGHVKKHTHSVTLAHISLFEYLTEPVGNITPGGDLFRFSPYDGHYLIASSCLSYLFHFNTLNAQKETHALLEYAWYNWEKHIPITPPIIEDHGRVRGKALWLFYHLERWADFPIDNPWRDPLLRTLDWLPQDSLETLIQALNTPFFYSNFDYFLAKASQSSGPNRVLSGHRSMRLLYPLPSMGRDDIVSCRLMEASLDDPPRFDAVSSGSGPENTYFMKSIVLNGMKIQVSETLHGILKCLCAQEQHQTPALWADEICLNRKNIEGRERDLLHLSATIFRAAREVVLCTVHRWYATTVAIATIRNLASHVSLHGTTPRTPPSATEQLWMVLILSAGYWKRLSHVQEIVLSRRGTVLAEPWSFPLSTLEDIFRPIYGMGNHISITHCCPTTRFLLHDGLWHVRNTILTRIEYTAGRSFEAAELLCRFARHESSNRVFRILELLELLPDIFSTDCPYSLEPFLEIVRKNLSASGNLNFLSHASGYRKREEIQPSWLPLYDNEMIPLVSCVKSKCIFKAGGTARPKVTRLDEDIEGHHLRASGVIISNVKGIFGDSKCKKDVFELRMTIESAYGQSCISLFWDVFLAGQSYYGFRLSEGSVLGMTVPPTTREEELPLLKSSELKSWPNFRKKRRFFLTSSGAIGLGPEWLQKGDVLVVLSGGSVPYLLRKESQEQGIEKWRFVGECYVNGFMDGEAVHEDTDWEDFCIY